MEPAVLFQDVSFSYQNQHPVLSGVNISISQGSFWGIVGPNGGGKSTLFKLLMGFLQPQCGSIQVLGMRPKLARKTVAYVPQSLHYDRKFPISVREVVLSGRLGRASWWGRYHTADRAAAREALRMVGLQDRQDEQFGALSGGQRQRALIARALASEPKILLLDEPTANIDSKAESEVYEILSQLKGSMTILMVTHDFRAAVELVDGVFCVQKEVVEVHPQQVCEHLAMGLYHSSDG